MDWKALIKQLTDAGMTQEQIASACGVSQTAISDLATGKSREPRYSTGRRLLDLAEQRMAA